MGAEGGPVFASKLRRDPARLWPVFRSTLRDDRETRAIRLGVELRGRVMAPARKWLRCAAIVLPLLSAACVIYDARPMDVPGVARAQATRTLDESAVEAVRARIAPDASAEGEADRLWLLAAILANDPKIAAARAAVSTAEAKARAERHVAAPALTLTSEYANDPATSSPWLIGGAISLPLDIGARRSSRLRAADLAVLIARYDFAEVVWAERGAARRALINRLIAQRRVTVSQELLALRDRHLAVLETRRKSGEISGADLELARLSREAAVQALAAARSQRAQAEETLASILGVRSTQIADRPWVWNDFDTPRLTSEVGGDARITAITARADILKALADYDRADAAYRGEIAKQFPALTVSPGYTWERGLVKLPVSLGLVLPPPDLNRHAIAAAAKARDEAGQHLEAVVASAAGEVDAASVERRLAMAALKDIRDRDLPVAQAMAKRAADRIRLGDISRVEWAEAQGALLDARLREIEGHCKPA